VNFRELKSALVRMYGVVCDRLADTIAPESDCTVVEIAKKIKAGDTLISFNYDTVIERLVSRIAGVRLRHGKRQVPGITQFAKPHGSTSWQTLNLPHAITEGEPILNSISYQGTDALLLGAVPLKSELIYEVQAYYQTPRVFEVVREQWLTLAHAVATAAEIVVLGYSFPKEDTYGRFFFHEGMAMRAEGLKLNIDVFNLNPEDLAPVARLFPAATFRFRGPVTPAPPPHSPPESGASETP